MGQPGVLLIFYNILKLWIFIGRGNDEFWFRILTMEKLPNKEVSMILPCAKRRRKILHSPKTSDKVNIYNLNDHPNNGKILNFGYLLLKGKLMQNVEFWQKQNPIKILDSPYIFPLANLIIFTGFCYRQIWYQNFNNLPWILTPRQNNPAAAVRPCLG